MFGEGEKVNAELIDERPAAKHEETTAVAVLERAAIDMQIATAHQYPRTLSRVKADMLSFATLDEETAATCFYTLPRGNKVIQGPSVRLAEIAVSSYGNLRAGARVIETVSEGPNPHVVVQAIAHDLEKNVAVTIEKRRRIVGKKKNAGKIDEDDINLACNACAAISFRDAVFKVVPLALIKPVYEAAKKVAVGDVKSLAVKRTQVVERLKQMGATEERILAVLEVPKVEDIGMDHLEVLIGLGTALRDGEITLEHAFPLVSKAASVIPQEPAIGKPKGNPEKPKNAAPKANPEPEPNEPEKKPEVPQDDPAANAEVPASERERQMLIAKIEEMRAYRARTFAGYVSEVCEHPERWATELNTVNLRILADKLDASKN
jgi:hypothetical protein